MCFLFLFFFWLSVVGGSCERNIFGHREGGKGEGGICRFCLRSFEIIRILGYFGGRDFGSGMAFFFFSRLGENCLLLYFMSISNLLIK